MELKALKYNLTVCKVNDFNEIDFTDSIFFIGKTDEELSLVCKTESAPETAIAREDGWKAFKIQGVLDFSLVGILSKISSALAENNIGIFAVSTFNTDYILVKEENFDKAKKTLKNAGYTVI